MLVKVDYFNSINWKILKLYYYQKKHISGFVSASLNVHVYMRLGFERIEFSAKK